MVTWQPDILPGFEAQQLPLPNAAPAAGEPAGSALCATLVRRYSARSRAALIYVHGWNDYFFQTHLAERIADLGVDFYALDLRRYGRSLQQGQMRGFVNDLDDYDAELGAAYGPDRHRT
jgi:alpha-beta hydrolase superfamily lysophospholipase